MTTALSGRVREPAGAAAPGAVEGEFTFLAHRGQRPVVYTAALTGEAPHSTAAYATRRVPVADGRPLADAFALEREGFELRTYPTAVADFADEAQVRAVYYPEVERLLSEATGAEAVLIFDHTVRVADAAGDGGTRRPVRTVHNDYTARSGPQRVRDLLAPEEARRRLAGRFAIVNVWRPIRAPVLAMPLAFADAQSVAPADLVPVDLVYPDRTGEIYEVAYDPGQRWVYFPRMAADEAVLIKGYDSAADGRARFTPHAAFDDPTTPPGAPPRASIEVRALVFFDSAEW